ncbi:NAD-dependent epimerase/dehydratase [Parvibaculum lavamentivorans DS-1]|uniref:NAD-dependent epimerase/dehydratase n=1 Tax=Parvibaculum lavamentivorans (strain DS-1 / DSM 13023 / NCIMB 13966) TaxID=402881 RepID=A7HYG9_PARL1|nr:NAD(P)-dependent oxidoreductase [Parvibaculum lavamentivorans]ABS64952.1 NAD-dependent epimerase/dehydratase [Parvibaculum lavamentivorans DS-1]
MRILLTGASGFVGRHALAALVRMGAEVHAVSRRRPPVPGDYAWHEGDLLVAGEAGRVMEEVRPDRVLHLAWCVEHGKFWNDPANLAWTAATLELAEAARRSGVGRFVGVGTCFEYDWPEEGLCDEFSTPLAGHTLYDTSKDATRRLLAAFFEDAGIGFSWARLFFLYGPDESPGRLVSSIARSLLSEEPALCSRGLSVRDFMDVRDCGHALAVLALSGVAGPINIATGEGTSVAEIATMMGEMAGRPDLIRLGSLPERTNEAARIVAATGRLKDELGFKSARTIEQGLREALSFWRGAVRGA